AEAVADRFEGRLDGLRDDLGAVEAELSATRDALERVEDRLGTLADELDALEERTGTEIEVLGERVDVIESFREEFSSVFAEMGHDPD
ncbi:hypothetical protein BRC93_12260, partial [Halobacteriales archaeon QS_5_70_15]